MWILYIVLALIAAVATFLLIRRATQPKPTRSELLENLFGNNEVVKTECDSSGWFHAGPIRFDALNPRSGLSQRERFLLHQEFGESFTVRFDGSIDLGLAFPPSLGATVTNESGSTNVKIW
jgi:hypothetical protein